MIIFIQYFNYKQCGLHFTYNYNKKEILFLHLMLSANNVKQVVETRIYFKPTDGNTIKGILVSNYNKKELLQQ